MAMSYGSTPKREVAQTETVVTEGCAVSGCESAAWPCFETHLCEVHVIGVNRARDAKYGLARVEWPEVVEYVAEWVRQQGLKKPENEART